MVRLVTGALAFWLLLMGWLLLRPAG